MVETVGLQAARLAGIVSKKRLQQEKNDREAMELIERKRFCVEAAAHRV